jgi:hypothetical protein
MTLMATSYIEPTACRRISFVESSNGRLGWNLARVVGSHQAVRPGDLVLWSLYNPNLEYFTVDHFQVVVKAQKAGSKAVWVAQHSPPYIHSLGFSVHHWEASGHGKLHTNFNYVILEPIHTDANS